MIRENRIIGDYPLESLKREKDDAREVREGLECGMKLGGFNDLKEGDMLEAYKIEEVARTFKILRRHGPCTGAADDSARPEPLGAAQQPLSPTTHDVATRSKGRRSDPRGRQHGDPDRSEGSPRSGRNGHAVEVIARHAAGQDPCFGHGGRNPAAI